MESVDAQILFAIFSLAYTATEIAAIITAVMAVRDTRTPQGAIAWAISLVALPIISLPLYWVFGRSKFHGYVEAMRSGEERFMQLIDEENDLPPVKKLSERRRPDAPPLLLRDHGRDPVCRRQRPHPVHGRQDHL